MRRRVTGFRGATIALVLTLAVTVVGSAFAGSASAGGRVRLSPTNVNFGVVLVGTVAQVQLSVTNQTGATVQITGTTLAGDFVDEFDSRQLVSNGTCSGAAYNYSLDPGENCTITIGFAPTQGGTVSQNARLELSGIPTVPFRVRGTGTGTG